MKNHPKVQQGLSLVDLKQIAMTCGSYIQEAKNVTFNGQEVFALHPQGGLHTFEELKKRFLN